MMIKRSTTDEQKNGLSDLAPDLTPMLDILFILLVFFMLTAGLALQSFDLQLPSSTHALTATGSSHRIFLEITERAYRLDGKSVKNFESLKRLLGERLKQHPKRKLTIASDKGAPIEKLLQLLIHLQSVGIEAANILMKKE